MTTCGALKSSNTAGTTNRSAADLLEHRAEPVQGPRLVAEVELLGDLHFETVHEPGECAGDADGDLAGDEVAQRTQHGEIDGDPAGDVGAQHLHRDRSAIGQRGSVHDGE